MAIFNRFGEVIDKAVGEVISIGAGNKTDLSQKATNTHWDDTKSSWEVSDNVLKNGSVSVKKSSSGSGTAVSYTEYNPKTGAEKNWTQVLSGEYVGGGGEDQAQTRAGMLADTSGEISGVLPGPYGYYMIIPNGQTYNGWTQSGAGKIGGSSGIPSSPLGLNLSGASNYIVLAVIGLFALKLVSRPSKRR